MRWNQYEGRQAQASHTSGRGRRTLQDSFPSLITRTFSVKHTVTASLTAIGACLGRPLFCAVSNCRLLHFFISDMDYIHDLVTKDDHKPRKFKEGVGGTELRTEKWKYPYLWVLHNGDKQNFKNILRFVRNIIFIILKIWLSDINNTFGCNICSHLQISSKRKMCVIPPLLPYVGTKCRTEPKHNIGLHQTDDTRQCFETFRNKVPSVCVFKL